MLNAIIDEVHRGEAGRNTLDLDENSQDASEDDAGQQLLQRRR